MGRFPPFSSTDVVFSILQARFETTALRWSLTAGRQELNIFI